MERTLEAIAKHRIGEGAFPQPTTVDGAVRLQALGSECFDDGSMACFAWRRHGVGDGVGLQHVGAKAGERFCDFRFTASDTTGQSHDVRHVSARNARQ